MTVHPCVSSNSNFEHKRCGSAAKAATALFDAIRELFVGAAIGRDMWAIRHVAANGRSYRNQYAIRICRGLALSPNGEAAPTGPLLQGRSYRAAPTRPALQIHSYGTTLIATPEYRLSTCAVLNDFAANL